MSGAPTLSGARVYELSMFARACFDAARWYQHDSEDSDRGPHVARQLAENGLWAIEQAVGTYNTAADAAEKRVDQVNDAIRKGRVPEADGPVAVRFSPRPPGLNLHRAASVVPQLPASEPATIHHFTEQQLAAFDDINRRQADRLDAQEAF